MSQNFNRYHKGELNLKRWVSNSALALFAAFGAVGCDSPSDEVAADSASTSGTATGNALSKPVTSLAAKLATKVSHPTNLVDVLFVVDTSGGMSVVQKRFADQMAPLVQSLENAGIDAQYAVTSMDMTDAGERGSFLYQGDTPAILNSKTPDLAAVLASRIFAGDYDWRPQATAFEATRAALTGVRAVAGVNAGFLRDDARLMVVYLSLNDDQSLDVDMKAIFDKIRPATATGERTWSAHFVGITADDEACKARGWNTRKPGQKYIDLANASNGAVESICSGDVAKSVAGVAAKILETVNKNHVVPVQKVIAINQ